jgi:hypothetical protein
MSVNNMPGFSGEASISRTRNYRERHVDGGSNVSQAVEAAVIQEVPINQRISVADFSLRTPWADCFCSTTEGWCSCVSR